RRVAHAGGASCEPQHRADADERRRPARNPTRTAGPAACGTDQHGEGTNEGLRSADPPGLPAMTLSPEALELHRARWKRARRTIHLDDPTTEGFGTGGLGRHAPDVHVRF